MPYGQRSLGGSDKEKEEEAHSLSLFLLRIPASFNNDSPTDYISQLTTFKRNHMNTYFPLYMESEISTQGLLKKKKENKEGNQDHMISLNICFVCCEQEEK